MSSEADPDRLAGHTDLADLIEQVTDGVAPRDAAHQASCRQCQATLARISEAWENVRGLAAEPVIVPSRLARRVMSALRAQAGSVTLEEVDQRGQTRVSHRLIARLARQAASSVEHVTYASVVVEGDPVRINVRLVVKYGPAVASVTRAVRERVMGELLQSAGIAVAEIDISIEDIEVD